MSMSLFVPKKRHKLKQETSHHRIHNHTKHFVKMGSAVNKWGLRRMVIMEVMPDCLPSRIDPRLKSIRHIIKVWQYKVAWMMPGKLTNKSAKRQMEGRIQQEANDLLYKLESLWPMHFAAKEVKGRVLYLRPLNMNNERSVNWLLRTIKALLPQSRRWLEQQGYITTTEEDGKPVIRLTPAGVAYFAHTTTKRGGTNAKTQEDKVQNGSGIPERPQQLAGD